MHAAGTTGIYDKYMRLKQWNGTRNRLAIVTTDIQIILLSEQNTYCRTNYDAERWTSSSMSTFKHMTVSAFGALKLGQHSNAPNRYNIRSLQQKIYIYSLTSDDNLQAWRALHFPLTNFCRLNLWFVEWRLRRHSWYLTQILKKEFEYFFKGPLQTSLPEYNRNSHNPALIISRNQQ